MAVSKPSVTISLLPANQEISTSPQRVLFVGQKVTAGTAVAGELAANIGNDGEEDALFGSNSMLAAAIRAFRKINPNTAIDAIPLADHGSGVAATGTLTFTGTASAAGTLYVTVGSAFNHRFTLPVASGATAASLATALVALVNGDTDCPVTASALSGAVTFTADNAGTEGNLIGLRMEGSVAGITGALVAMASGATNPTLTGIFNVCADTRYQTVVWPSSWGGAEVLTNFLDGRFNVNNDVKDGVVIRSLVDTKANHVSALAALNNKNEVYFCGKLVNDTLWKGNGWQEIPMVVSAYFAAVRSLRFTPDVDLSRYVTTTTGLLDSIGGPALASLPYFNTPIPYLNVIPVGKDWTMAEVETLAAAGGSVIGNNRSNNTVIVGDVLTTYKTDPAGNTDVTFKYLNSVDTGSNVREYFFNNSKNQYAQTRLTNGDLLPGRSMANRQSIAAYFAKLYQDLAGSDYVLLQAGEEALNFFKTNLVITLDLAQGKVTATAQVPIVTQLRSIIMPMQIAFTTT